MKLRFLLLSFLFCVYYSFSQTKKEENENYLRITSTTYLENLLKSANNDEYVITSEYTDAKTGIKHTYIRQAINGIEVFGTESSLHTNANGQTIMAHVNFVANIGSSLKNSSASITATQAISSVAQQMGYSLSNLQRLENATGSNQKGVFNKAGISNRDIPVKLMYYFRDGHGSSMVWELSVMEKNTPDWWNFRVDASSGIIIDKDNWTVNCGLPGDHSEEGHKAKAVHGKNIDSSKNISVSNYSVATENYAAPSSYNVFSLPLESPYFGPRTLVVNPYDLIASPLGWHNDGTSMYTYTKGNNVAAYDDGLGDDTASVADHTPESAPGLIFDYPFDSTAPNGDPNYFAALQSQDAAVTNLFYWNNIIHDIMYYYGFDEASGNFQESNVTAGGLGGDSVNAEAQDEADLAPTAFNRCNANFGTPPDGSNPRMQMYICDNGATAGHNDGDYDNFVVVHEYAHGISNRLVGGPADADALNNAEQMGEGWSDFYGYMLTMDSGNFLSDRTGGTFLFDQGPGGPGIRNAPYSTSMTTNPFTYADVADTGTVSSPHGIGFIWASMLYEMAQALIARDGFDADLYNGTGGNNKAIALVTEGLKLTPPNPGFVDGRDAILAADLELYGGANQCLIWTAFAKRGLGFSADQGSSFSRIDGVEAYDMPGSIVPSRSSICIAEGIVTGISGGILIGGVYSGPFVTDAGNGTTFSFDAETAGVGTHTITYTDPCLNIVMADIMVTSGIPELICQDVSLTLDANGDATLNETDVVDNLPPSDGSLGYTVDSSGTFAPADMSTGTTVLTLSDDGGAGIPISFPFSFYGNEYTTVYVASNGYLSFEDDDIADFSNDPIPTASLPNNIIAVAWDDLNPVTGGTIHYKVIGTAPMRTLVVEYDNIFHFGSTSLTMDTQVMLYETSNLIEIHSSSITSDGGTRTQGIENEDGTAGEPVTGRNSTDWTATNDYVGFIPNGGGLPDNCDNPVTITLSQTAFTCADIGANTVTVTADDGMGGIATCEATVTVVSTNPPIDDPTGTNDIICSGETATLTAIGTGGTLNWYSDDTGTSLVETGTSFTTGVLTQTTSFYVQEVGGTGCSSNLVEVMAEVNPLPTVNFTALGDLFIDAGVQAGLGGGTPLGGVYSGPGVTDDGNGMTYSFDPAAAGLGTHVLTYMYSDPDTGCMNSASDEVVVDAVIVEPCVVSIDTQPQDITLCQGGEGSIFVEASGTGTLSYLWQLKFQGIGEFFDTTRTVSNFLFNGIDLVANGNEYRVIVTSDNGTPNDTSDDCSVTSDIAVLTVNPATEVSIEPVEPLCIDGQIVQLGASPEGGSWDGPGVDEDGMFNPILAGVGDHVITYTYEEGENGTLLDRGVGVGNPDCPYLMITGVFDGTLSGGQPKGVELFALQDIQDLSSYGVGSANNGGGSDGEEFTFPNDVIVAGTYIYVAANEADFMTWFGFDPDYVTGAVNVNGDDAIELFGNGEVIDTYGEIDVNSDGQSWDYTNSWAYRNSSTGPDGTTWVESNWSYAGLDVWNGQTSNDGASMMPIGTFTAPECDGNGPTCPGSAQITIVVNDLPTVTLTGLTDQEVNTGVVTLGGGSPVGGMYSGIGVTDDGNGETFSFDTAFLDGGQVTVTYTYMDPVTGCSNSATDEIGLLESNAPANDLCGDAIAIECGSTVSGTTVDATFDEAPFCGASNTAPGVWYSFIGIDGTATLSTCDTASYDTKISVFEGTCDGLSCVDGNDDGAGCAGFTSELTIDTVAGVEYLVLVHGFNTATGTFDLSLTCENPCADDAEGPAITMEAQNEMVDCPSEGSSDSCMYYIQLFDSLNDGWQGDILDVLVNGEVVLDDLTLTDLFNTGNDPIPGEYDPIPFSVMTDDVITTEYQVGAFSGEASWEITDSQGNVVAQGNGSNPTDIVANCAAPSAEELFMAWLDNNGGAEASDDNGVTWSNNACSENAFTVDGNAAWGSFDNLFFLDDSYCCGFDGPPANVGPGNQVTIQPNYTSGDDVNVETNVFVAADNALASQSFTFSGNVTSNTLTDGYGATAWIKLFDGGFGLLELISVPLSEGPFTVEYNMSQPGAVNIQYGFSTYGLGGAGLEPGSLGNVVIEAVSCVSFNDECGGETTVTFTATDACGNTSETTATFSIGEETGCPAENDTYDWTGAVNTDWENPDNWMNQSAPGLLLSNSDVTIPLGMPNYPILMLGQDLYIDPCSTVFVDSKASLTVNPNVVVTNDGTVMNDGNSTFESDETGTAYIGTGTGMFIGDFTVERFIPAKRAYRQLSPAVTTSGPISENWQMDTHITGPAGNTDGFDETLTGNPSMYIFDNDVYNYLEVENTNATNLYPGTMYHILVRGDRNTDLGDNNATPSITTLKATGELTAENEGSKTIMVDVPEQRFIAAGNPFQSQIDMYEVITVSAVNIDPVFYWVWDPTLGERGAYTAIIAETGVASSADTDANQYLQAGQAGWVYTAGAGPSSLTFDQNSKSNGVPETVVFRGSSDVTSVGQMRLSLYENSALANNGNAADGVLILFDTEGNNGVDMYDALNITNLDENMATNNNGVLLSIENRAAPVDAEEIQLEINTYRSTDYTIVAEGIVMEGATAFLYDIFTDTLTEIPQNGSVNYTYSVDSGDAASIAGNRFKIVFAGEALSVNDYDIDSILMYPNPSNIGKVYLDIPLGMDDLEVSIYNVIGTRLYHETGIAGGNRMSIEEVSKFSLGTYFVELSSQGRTITKKLIIN
ncbi:M36 family metallopeptidase [Winogradskyella sp. A2]|uniref:M36 family metallopeptidase n=1 Tax=Winogradskyella sp. A2 TaxID=3366944 RepID=UPI00398C7890